MSINGNLILSFECPTCHNSDDVEIHSFDALDIRFSSDRKVLLWDGQCPSCHEIITVKAPV